MILLFYELLFIVIETKNIFDDLRFSKDEFSSFHSGMTTRSQKKKAVAELAPGEFEASTPEHNLVETLVAGPSKSPKLQPEKLDEIKTSLGKEIKCDLPKILAISQKEMLKLISPAVKKTYIFQT